jgi:hypothetical protein
LDALPQDDIIQYDVMMEPSLPKVFVRVFDSMVRQYGATVLEGAHLCYDGRSIVYASKPLAKNQYQLDVILEEDEGTRQGREPRPFRVTLKRVATVKMALLQAFLQGQLNYTPYVAMTALEVIMKRACTASKLVSGNRSFYSPQHVNALSGPIEAWSGLFESLRPSPGRLLLNVDTTSTCFYKSGSLLDLVLDVLGVSRQRLPPALGHSERSRVERTIRGLFVKTTHGTMRKYRVIGLCDTNAETTLFTGKDERLHSVIEYFMQTYNLRIQYPYLPCVNAGTKQRPIAIPLECLTIVEGQKYPKRLNDVQAAEMIKISAMKPRDKLQEIEKSPGTLALAQNATLKAFGIEVRR